MGSTPASYSKDTGSNSLRGGLKNHGSFRNFPRDLKANMSTIPLKGLRPLLQSPQFIIFSHLLIRCYCSSQSYQVEWETNKQVIVHISERIFIVILRTEQNLYILDQNSPLLFFMILSLSIVFR